MHRILITGGAGFIGSSLAEHLLKRPDCEVVLVDNMLTGLARNLPPSGERCRFIKCDTNAYEDIAAVMLTRPFDFVFHYAAVVGVQRTLANPVMVLQDIDGIRNVLNLCKNTGVRRVFFASSSEVYGEPFEFPQNEHTTPLNSRLPYAVVKNVGEAFLRSYHKEFGLPYTIFRFFNTYGPRQNPDFVVARFIRQALAGEGLTIYGDGSQTRTFCFIDDNVEATANACFKDQFVNDVINIGNDLETPVLELAKAILQVTASRSKIVHLPPLAEGDMDRRKPDITKMRSLLPRPLTELAAGLRETVRAKRG